MILTVNPPSVTAVMLTANRPELARRAIAGFIAQTYPNKKLYIYDTGEEPIVAALPDQYPLHGIVYHRGKDLGRSVGELRNWANSWASAGHKDHQPDILWHLDDDDWSHPNRMAEQVELLQSSGADCVGYNELLFWREAGECDCQRISIGRGSHETFCRALVEPGEAWLYSQPNPRSALGTSLCYWREVWERNPFPALQNGEDTHWLMRVRCHSVTSLPIHPDKLEAPPLEFRHMWPVQQPPRMIARIHPGNAGNLAYKPNTMAACEAQGDSWQRVPHWDEHCRNVME